MSYVNPYTKCVWVDESDEYEDRYTETMNPDGTISHEKVRGEVYVEGTPMDAAHFNNMEDGIFGAHEKLVDLDDRAGTLEDLTLPEVHTVTRTNTLEIPFNDSLESVAFTKERDNLNYIVEVVKVECEGNYGEIQVADRQVNGFKIGYTGSAASAKITFAVTGGFDQ